MYNHLRKINSDIKLKKYLYNQISTSPFRNVQVFGAKEIKIIGSIWKINIGWLPRLR